MYAKNQDEQLVSAQKEYEFLVQENLEESTEAKVQEAVKAQVEKKTTTGSRKPAVVKKLLEQAHSRDMLIALASVGTHFRIDEALWQPTTLSRHLLNVNGMVSAVDHSIFRTVYELMRMVQFISEVVTQMAEILMALCRRSEGFEDVTAVQNKWNELTKMTNQVASNATINQKTRASKLRELRQQRLELWNQAMGVKEEEPAVEILLPHIMDAFDNAYNAAYRPNAKSKTELDERELIISWRTPAGMTSESIAKIQLAYVSGMKKVARAAYKEALGTPGINSAHLELYRQMEAKLAILLLGATLPATNMPSMPLLTRRSFRMVLMRYQNVEDASREVGSLLL
jgi:hypothetical protein